MVRKRAWLTLLVLATVAIGESASAKEVLYAAMGPLGVKTFDLSGMPLNEFPFVATQVAADDSGDIFVSNVGATYAVRFDANGAFRNFFLPTRVPGDNHVITGGIAVDANHDVYLSAQSVRSTQRIEKFDASGTSLGMFAPVFESSMTFGAAGNMYTSSGQRIAPDGTLQTLFSGGYAFDIALDSLNNIYTTYGFSGIYGLSKHGPDGQLIQWVDLKMDPLGVAFDANDVMYVGGSVRNQPVIRRFRSDGTPLGDFIVFPPAGFLDVVWDLAIVDVVPEPSSFLLALGALSGVAPFARRRSPRLRNDLENREVR